MRVFPKCNARISAVLLFKIFILNGAVRLKTVEIYCDFCCEDNNNNNIIICISIAPFPIAQWRFTVFRNFNIFTSIHLKI